MNMTYSAASVPSSVGHGRMTTAPSTTVFWCVRSASRTSPMGMRMGMGPGTSVTSVRMSSGPGSSTERKLLVRSYAHNVLNCKH